MPAVDSSGVQPLIGYPWWVTLLGALLLLIVIGVAGWVWWWTRAAHPRFATGVATPPAAGPVSYQLNILDLPYDLLRAHHLQQISDLARHYESGQIDSRTAHQGLAAIVRAHTSSRLHRDISALTVAEFAAAVGDGPAAGALHAYLAPSFDGRGAPASTTRASITTAWEVIQRW